jgi:hypothetical protein
MTHDTEIERGGERGGEGRGVVSNVRERESNLNLLIK